MDEQVSELEASEPCIEIIARTMRRNIGLNYTTLVDKPFNALLNERTRSA